MVWFSRFPAANEFFKKERWAEVVVVQGVAALLWMLVSISRMARQCRSRGHRVEVGGGTGKGGGKALPKM